MIVLGTLIEQIRGLSYSKKDVVANPIDGYKPVLRAGNIQGGQIIEDNYVYVPKDLIKEKQLLRKGDVLIAASSGSLSIVGKAAMVNKNIDATFGAFCKVLRPNHEDINQEYFKHYFETSYYKRTIKSLAEGANINNLKTEHFNNLEIPLPPLDQQKKIAAILDAADAYRQKTKALITKYDELTQSLFLDMFGDAVRNPMGHKIVTLNDVTSKITDGVHFKPNYTESGIEFISVKDITTGVLKFDKCKFISKEAHDKYYKRCNPEYLDILYTKVGATYGRPAIVDVKREFSLYVSAALIKPIKELINPYYLKDAMANPAIKRQADRSIKGIGVPDLHLDMIRKFLIPLPSMKEQNQFAERVQAIELQKAQAEASLAQAQDLFNSLLQRAFKGELVN